MTSGIPMLHKGVSWENDPNMGQCHLVREKKYKYGKGNEKREENVKEKGERQGKGEIEDKRIK
jgi:hypothetical protein